MRNITRLMWQIVGVKSLKMKTEKNIEMIQGKDYKDEDWNDTEVAWL